MFPPDAAGMADDAGELTRRIGPPLDAALQELGLYVTQKTITAQATAEGTTEAIAVLVAVIGRIAFSDHVQQPHQEAVNDVFTQIVESEIRKQYDECEHDDLHGD